MKGGRRRRGRENNGIRDVRATNRSYHGGHATLR